MSKGSESISIGLKNKKGLFLIAEVSNFIFQKWKK
jgi:hypothetical protein